MPTTDLMIQALVAMRHDPNGPGPQHFWQLVERFRADLVNQALALLGNQQDAEDVAQESLCQAFQDLAQLRDPQALGAWMRTLNKRNAIRFARKRRAQFHREERLPTGANPAVHETRAHGDLERERLARAIDGLPDEYRAVVLFRFWEHRSYEEIGEILGVPVGTVNSRMARAYRLLCQRLKPAALKPSVQTGVTPPAGSLTPPARMERHAPCASEESSS